MSNSRPSNIKFWTLASAVLLATAGSVAALWPLALQAARAESAALVNEGAKTSGGEAETDYRLATWLNSGNQTAYAGLAAAQITGGEAGDALVSLDKAGEGSGVNQLKVRTLIELGRPRDAAAAAPALTGAGAPDSDLVLAALAYSLDGRIADAAALTPRVSSPEALQAIERAQAAPITLAGELYATGLLQSSSTLLARQPVSFERNLLLARIRYARHTSADLSQAANLLTVALGLNPSSVEARQLLAKVYRDQRNAPAADQQSALAAKLQSGRP